MFCYSLKSIICAFAIVLGLGGVAFAIGSDVVLVTGTRTGTYFTFGNNIAEISRKTGLTVDARPSEGSIDNIKTISSYSGAGLGIVQADVLGFLSRSKNPESMHIAENLRIVYPFYNEEVHILARRNIGSFQDLQGKKVAIGEDESGSMLTAINLFSMMEIKPQEMLKIPADKGVVRVLKGEIDAIVFVGGKPVRLFRNLEDLSRPENGEYAPLVKDVHFIPLDSPKMLEEYRPATISKLDYKFVDKDIPTIAVPSVLVSYAGDGRSADACKKIGQLAKIIRDFLPTLKASSHPKWQEVDLDRKIGNWKKDDCLL